MTFLYLSEDVLDTEDEAVDPSMKSDTDHIVETFCEEWVSQLDRDDRFSLGLFLCSQMTRHLEIKETRAAELAGLMIGKSDKTIREWRKQFYENDGVHVIPESQQGKYVPAVRRAVVKWGSWINLRQPGIYGENVCVKGWLNLIVAKFCEWVNEDLLSTQHLSQVFPARLELRPQENGWASWDLVWCPKRKGHLLMGMNTMTL